MKFFSTRSGAEVSPAQAIARGLAADGGLFVPESFPALTAADLAAVTNMDYRNRAKFVLGKYLTDFSEAELAECVTAAYGANFDTATPAPVVEVEPGVHFLELWHGPTCAFKDMALQILPHLLGKAVAKVSPGLTTVILVATSGDTGKAALAGFADAPGTKIIVFYPRFGVSDMQKLQMTTQVGNNVAVCAINGNFDHAQSGVKAIFADEKMRKFLAERNLAFSSANSINFGRLVPQVVYYVSAYCDLVKSGKIAMGDPINVVVPTGNFGNILAAVYARNMGIPIAKFICASNANRVLTDFINTGIYDRNREFFTTTSPSMDILISSNLERLLYLLYHNDSHAIAQLMKELQSTGRYTISAEARAQLQKDFWGGSCDDAATASTIGKLFTERRYLCDPHTAVGVNVYNQYRQATGDDRPTVIASTASPYKFAPAVLPAITSAAIPADGFAQLELLAKLTGTAIPAPLAALRSLPPRHLDWVEKEQMADFITRFLS